MNNFNIENENQTILSDRLSVKWARWKGRAWGIVTWLLQGSKRKRVGRGHPGWRWARKSSLVEQLAPMRCVQPFFRLRFFSLSLWVHTDALCNARIVAAWEGDRRVYIPGLIRSALKLLEAKLTSLPVVPWEAFYRQAPSRYQPLWPWRLTLSVTWGLITHSNYKLPITNWDWTK